MLHDHPQANRYRKLDDRGEAHLPAGTAEPGDKAPQSLPPKGDVVGIFPNRLSARRLVGAVLAEQHDEWAEARRYLTIPNAAGNEALPEPNMLDAAA